MSPYMQQYGWYLRNAKWVAQAVRWRLRVVNPSDAVAPVKVPKRKPIALDTDEAAQLVELLNLSAFQGPVEPGWRRPDGVGLRQHRLNRTSAPRRGSEGQNRAT